jgi:hypothetical protein
VTPAACRNPKCGELVRPVTIFELEFGPKVIRLTQNNPLCPSCRYVSRWGFAIGAFLAGVVSWWVR